jgi:hypothetical protein
MLSIGSSGKNVKKAQELLNRKTIVTVGSKPLAVDGRFGTETVKMVMLFHKQKGIKQTGQIDNSTGVKLGMYPDELKSDPVVIKGAATNKEGTKGPSIVEKAKNLFQENKRNVIIVTLGLGAVFIISVVFKNKRQVINVKSNPGKKKNN